MRFPIDALFLDNDLQVLDIVERLQPWRMASRRHARAVLELAEGECARRGVQVGDKLTLRERKPAAQAAPGASRTGSPGNPESIIWAPSLSYGSGAAAARLRVLIVSEDRHFRSVTTMLLAHRGCVVTTTANASSI